MAYINNLHPNYRNYPYVVARKCDGEWWYWGSYSTLNSAADAAWEEGGEVFRLEEVERGRF